MGLVFVLSVSGSLCVDDDYLMELSSGFEQRAGTVYISRPFRNNNCYDRRPSWLRLVWLIPTLLLLMQLEGCG